MYEYKEHERTIIHHVGNNASCIDFFRNWRQFISGLRIVAPPSWEEEKPRQRREWLVVAEQYSCK
jgi:hypothetical protein